MDPLCLFYNLFHFPPLLCLRYLTHHQHTFEKCLVPAKPYYYFPYNLFIYVITPRQFGTQLFQHIHSISEIIRIFFLSTNYTNLKVLNYTFDIRFNFFWYQLKTLFVYFMFWWRDNTKNKRNIIGSVANIFIIHDKTNFIACVCFVLFC